MKNKKFNLNINNDPFLKRRSLNDIIINHKNNQFINPFSLFCSKSDFIIKKQVNNNLSSRMPFLGGRKLKNYVMDNISHYTLRSIFDNYFDYMGYNSKNRFKHWFHFKKRIKYWIKESFFPLPLIRVITHSNSKYNSNTELISILKKIDYVTDYQHRAKFIYPKTIKQTLNERLIYFAGCVFGDGTIHYEDSIIIADGHPNKDNLIYSEDFLNKIKYNLTQDFNINVTIQKTKGNYFLLKFTNKWFVRLFKCLFNIDSGKKINIRLPPLLKEHPNLQKLFWRGIFDTDGRVSEINNAITISSMLKPFLIDLSDYLSKFKISHKLTKLTNKMGSWYNLYIYSFELKNFCEIIGSCHPRKQKVLDIALKKGPARTIFKGIKKSSTLNGYFNVNLLNVNNFKQKNEIKYFPKKSSNNLLRLARFVRSKNPHVLTLIRKDKGIILTDEQINGFATKIENIFKTKRKFERDKKIPYFYNSLLSRFFSTYFNYKKPWDIDSSYSFINEWDKIWINE